MDRKKRYLVAVDGSESSKSAVRYVASMLSPVNTEVVLFHVLNRIPEAYWDFGMGIEIDSLSKEILKHQEAHEIAIKAFMAEARQVLLDADFREENVSVDIKDRVAGVARDVMAEARRNYDGLVMGSTGAGRTAGHAIGSVSVKIIGALTVLPICMVAGKPVGRSLIVALDGSEGSMRALDYACSLINGAKEKVVLFHALRHIGHLNTTNGTQSNFSDVEKAVWADIKKMLQPTIAEAKERIVKAGGAGNQVVTKFATGVPSRARALIETAHQTGCGTIIVGRTGISRVEDFNIGRVANKVVQAAHDQAVWIVP